jgi:hypothetical protein
MRAAVQSGASSMGTWPMSGATSNRQSGWAPPIRRAADRGTRMSRAPCSNRVGWLIRRNFAAVLAGYAITIDSERAERR